MPATSCARHSPTSGRRSTWPCDEHGPPTSSGRRCAACARRPSASAGWPRTCSCSPVSRRMACICGARPTDLGRLVAETADSFAGRAEGLGVELVTEVDGDLVALVDGMRLRQALGNLLDNALRSTPRGGRVTAVGEGNAGRPDAGGHRHRAGLPGGVHRASRGGLPSSRPRAGADVRRRGTRPRDRAGDRGRPRRSAARRERGRGRRAGHDLPARRGPSGSSAAHRPLIGDRSGSWKTTCRSRHP